MHISGGLKLQEERMDCTLHIDLEEINSQHIIAQTRTDGDP
jgi:hypothetical protein